MFLPHIYEGYKLCFQSRDHKQVLLTLWSVLFDMMPHSGVFFVTINASVVNFRSSKLMHVLNVGQQDFNTSN